MAKDPFVLLCQTHGITDMSLVSHSNSAKIYRGSYVSTQLPVGIKYLQHLDQVNCQQLLDEYQKFSAFKDFPNVVKVYETFAFQTGQDFSLAIVQEWLDKDLSKEIQYRSTSANYWTDAEIMEMEKVLICALAFLQEQGVTHRDINPQSIFIDQHMQVKIGNFGSSRRFDDMGELSSLITITGTPCFMSPELKQQMMLRSSKGYYNPYKSDVYSLGLTMLTAYKLQTPTSLLNMSTLTECTAAELASVTSLELRDLFAYMLAADSANRPDFIQLRDLLSGPQVPVVLAVDKVAQCPHLVEGGLNYYQFRCHGYFCTECTTRVEQIGLSEDLVRVRAYCPMCSSSVDYWTKQVSQPNSANPLSIGEDQNLIHSEKGGISSDAFDAGNDQEKHLDSCAKNRADEATDSPGEGKDVHHSQSASDSLCRESAYPCNPVIEPSYVQEQRDQIGVYFTNPIPTTVWKSDADLCCIHCSTEMSVISKTQAIVIRCAEGHTMNYCTRACFIKHVESVTREYIKDFACFRCGQSISQERIIPLYGGVERFAKEKAKFVQKEFMCVVCKETLATHALEECRHIYCFKCVKAVRKLFPTRYTCRKCGTLSRKKHVLGAISSREKKPTGYIGKDQAKVANLI